MNKCIKSVNQLPGIASYKLAIWSADQSSIQSTDFMITSPAPQKVASWAGEISQGRTRIPIHSDIFPRKFCPIRQNLLTRIMYIFPGHNTIYVKSFKGENLEQFLWIFANHECFNIENFPWISVPSTNYTKHGTTCSLVLNCDSFPYILNFSD